MSLFSAPILALFLLGIFTPARPVRRVGGRRGRGRARPPSGCSTAPTVNWTYYFPFAFLVTMVVAYGVSLVWRGEEAPAHLTIYGRKGPPA